MWFIEKNQAIFDAGKKMPWFLQPTREPPPPHFLTGGALNAKTDCFLPPIGEILG